MGMKDSAKALSARFKLDSHHAIERFGVLFGVLCVSAVVLFASTGVSAFSNNKQVLSSTALYTPTFTTSKTELSGDVSGVFVSEDRTRAMVLMQFDDTSKVSVNAEDYQGFLTGSSMDLNQQDLKTTVAGSVYVFGSTGYMGVMLDSDKPFAAQVMDLTMRANTELVYREVLAEEDGESTGDSSFQKYDQWRVFFNPGGSEATVSKALGSEQVDAGAVFNELVVAAEEKDIRGRMDAQLALMKTDLNRINDATAELARTTADSGTLRLMPPEVPAQIAGDEITGEPKSGQTPSTLDLKTGVVLQNGYDFDWRGTSVMDGYLQNVVPEGSNYVSFLAERNAAAADNEEEFRVNDIGWILNDGSDLKRDYDSGNTTVRPLTDIMNKLSLAYQDYYSNKQTYQVDMHTELLDLEVNLRNVDSNSTKNDGQDAIRSY